jgi:hypothetical protein
MRSRNAAYVGTHDIADRMGLSSDYVAATVVKAPGFPDPCISMSRKTRLWDRVAFEAWLEARRIRGASQSLPAMRGSRSGASTGFCDHSRAPA